MTVHMHPEMLSYFSVPKCGCTSLKSFFFHLIYGLPFAEAKAQGHPAIGEKAFVHNVFPSQPFERTRKQTSPDYVKIAVVRDPVSRIMSCYTNKVHQKGVLKGAEMADRAAAAGLSATPTFSDFLNNLDGYQELSSELHHHSLPLSHFLGTDPTFFTRILSLADLPLLTAFVETHVGRTVPPLPHVQRSRQSDRPREISPQDFSLIERRFAEDVELYGAFFAPQSAANSA